MTIRDYVTWLAALGFTVGIAYGAVALVGYGIEELQRCFSASDVVACLTGGGQ